MTINFTLVVQIINFIIAYFIISRILLKPAISLIQNDFKTENSLLNLINLKKEEVRGKEIYKKALFEKAQSKLLNEKPSLEIEKSKIIWKVPTTQKISDTQKNELEVKISDLIITKVTNVK